MRVTCGILLLVLFIFPVSGQGSVIVAPADYPTIQECIDVSNDGDVIIVLPGYYKENIFFMGKKIKVMSSTSADETVLSGFGCGPAVSFTDGEDANSTLEGFTITGCHSENGGAIYCQNSAPLIRENVLSENTAHVRGGAVYGMYASPTIVHNLIRDNHVEVYGGGGIYFRESEPRIEDNCIAGNHASYHGGGISMWRSSGVIEGNIIHSNYAEYASAGIHLDNSSPAILCNTLHDNTCGSSAAIHCGVYSNPLISNNIITETNHGFGIDAGGGSQPEIMYNDVWGNSMGSYYGCSPGPGSISEDPLFRGEGRYFFELESSSPCIDAGDPLDTPPPPGGNRIDMGAFEFFIDSPVALHIEHMPAYVSRRSAFMVELEAANLTDREIPVDFWYTICKGDGYFGNSAIHTDTLQPGESVGMDIVVSTPPWMGTGSYTLDFKVGDAPLETWTIVTGGISVIPNEG